jgi:hypothetical protein
MGSVVTQNLMASGLPSEAGYTLGFLALSGVSLAAVLAAVTIPALPRSRR